MARYSESGNRSYYNLFRYEYMGLGPLPSGKKTNADAMVNMLPFSFIENGRYESGEPTTRRGVYGSYKISRVYSRNLNNVFIYYESDSKIYFSIQTNITKSRGDSVCCGDKFENEIKNSIKKWWGYVDLNAASPHDFVTRNQ